MFVDASALTAILTDETDARALLARLQNTTRRITSPLAVWESVVAVARSLGSEVADAEIAVMEFLALAQITVQAVPPEASAIALQAFARFGKGRHPAALNFGDCFAYACARHAGVALLYKGDGFPLTDIDAA